MSIDPMRLLNDAVRGLGTRAGVIAPEPPPPPPAPTGARAAAARAQAVAGPAARAIVVPAQAVARPAARRVASPAQAMAGPAARALAGPAARALAAHAPPPPSRVDAARAASARMARGSGGLMMPEQLAHRLGLASGRHAVATPGIGPVIGLRDFALGFLVLVSLDDPVRLRAAIALARAVDAGDAAILAAPMRARRVAGLAAMRGGGLALQAAEVWRRVLRWD
jgi:hypothetical protein